MIHVIIGRKEQICGLAEDWIYAKEIPLEHGFSMIPLTDELLSDIDELSGTEGQETGYTQFYKLSAGVVMLLKESSLHGALAYCETEYFGGGVQHAILFEKGKVALGPFTTETKWFPEEMVYRDIPEGKRAINTVLAHMGVYSKPQWDEFDIIGLGERRSLG